MPTADPLLLDTHVLLWWQAGSDRLSPRARRLIDAAPRLFLSAISVCELATLVGQGRIALDRPTQIWVHDLLADGIVTIAELTPTIAVAAAQLDDFGGDHAEEHHTGMGDGRVGEEAADVGLGEGGEISQ